MGFEELAALKQQLSKQSQSKRGENGDSRGSRATQSEREARAAAAAHSAEQSRTTEHRPQAGARPAEHGGQKRTSAPGQARPGGSRGPRPPRPEGARADGASRPGARRGNADGRREQKPGEAAPADGQATAAKSGPGHQGARTGAGNRPARDRQPGTSRPARPARPERQVDPVVVTIGQLQKHFPLAFPKNPEPKKPLKLGISKDLAAQAEGLSLTEPAILEAIKVWCQGSRYWAAMTNGAARVGLTGEPDGIVTPEQAGHARYLAAAARRAKRQDKQAESGAATSTPEGTVAAEAADQGDVVTADAAKNASAAVADTGADAAGKDAPSTDASAPTPAESISTDAPPAAAEAPAGQAPSAH